MTNYRLCFMLMVYIFLATIGLALGSFCNALAWRVYKQSSLKNRKTSSKYSILRGRSMCPECEHTLSVADLIPVFSWLLLGGRCRYCNKKISIQYPFVELIFVFAVLISYQFWPLSLSTMAVYLLFGIWLILLVIGFSMSIIDIKWQILPSKLVYLFGALSVTATLLLSLNIHNIEVLVNSIIGGSLLFLIFWSIYQVSGGKWIGGGDVRLLGVMGILLGWQKGLIAVVFASYLATIFVIGLALARKYSKKMRIPFGPFLLLGTYVAFLFGDILISFYKQLSGL